MAKTKADLNASDIIDMYKAGSSTYDIAEAYQTNATKIRRLLIKHKVELRGKSEAQKKAIASGKAEHPTKGRKRTEAERLAISTSAVRYWENMDDKEREKRRKQAEDNWNKMSESQKEDMKKKGFQEIRKAAVNGSKLEREVQKFVSNAGYRFEAHKKDMIMTAKKNYEIDLFIPAISTIIEVDGLSHFEPIWGIDALKEQMKYDSQKDGIALSKGYHIVRIENRTSSMALSKLAELEKELVETLKEIEKGNAKPQIKVIKYE